MYGKRNIFNQKISNNGKKHVRAAKDNQTEKNGQRETERERREILLNFKMTLKMFR